MYHTVGRSTKALCVLLLSAAAVLQAVSAGPAAARTSRLAKYTTQCKIKDSKINECLTRVVGDILKHSRTGIPELKIPALEPFLVPELDLKVFEGIGTLFGSSPQRSNKTKAVARNLLIHQTSDYQLHNLKANLEKNEFFVDATFPKLRVEGEYDVNLFMFGMPIKSIGPFLTNATNVDVKATVFGKTLKRKNNSYLQFNSIDIKVDFTDFSLAIDKLFKKDQNMNRALNDLIKNQKTELRKLATPMIEELAGKIILQMLNHILSDLPLEEIFISE